MAQQTAVEWLENELGKWLEGRVYLPLQFFEQAKELEKQQIINAVDKTRNKLVIGEEFNAPWSDDEVLSNGERYYKYIFGGQGTDEDADKTK